MILYHDKDGKVVKDVITTVDALVATGNRPNGLFFTKL